MSCFRKNADHTRSPPAAARIPPSEKIAGPSTMAARRNNQSRRAGSVAVKLSLLHSVARLGCDRRTGGSVSSEVEQVCDSLATFPIKFHPAVGFPGSG